MKKHILGFTIFAFIVGSFISVFALLGYFTQTIPNVPKVESDNLPVFKSDRKTSCSKPQREKISYEVVDSYYFADEKKVVSTLKLKRNGYGITPKGFTVVPKIFNSNNREMLFPNNGTYLQDVFSGNNEVFVTVSSSMIDSADLPRKDNFYIAFDFISDQGFLTVKQSPSPHEVTFVHGDSSTISR